MEIKTQLTHVGNRTATDESGRTFTLMEFSELVSVKELAGFSAWQPRNGHGQYMTLNGKPLERITAHQWETTEHPPVRLTLQPG